MLLEFREDRLEVLGKFLENIYVGFLEIVIFNYREKVGG